MTGTFAGAKLMLFLGPALVVIQRDDVPHIPWPGYLDFPGGAREGDETPEACALRETREEIGLRLSDDDLVWKQPQHHPGWMSWFFAAHLPADTVQQVVFGNEGAGWALMQPDDYLRAGKAIPHFAEQLRRYLAARG